MAESPEDRLVIDDKKRFSETVLWKLQRAFYEKSEVKCWQECVVPNFVTSNCFIAQAYARSIASFLRDHLGRDGSDWGSSQKPVYIVEIGAGSAKLSFVLLQKLLKLSEYLPRRRESGPGLAGAGAPNGTSNDGSGGGGERGGFCFKYVITDFSHANFGFWMNHPRLQDLFALGIVDFAVFDAEAGPGEIGGKQGPGTAAEGRAAGDSGEVGDRGAAAGSDGGSSSGGGGGPGVGLWGSGCLRLELSGEELRPGDLDNPVIVVANYVFDSLKQDAFRVHEGALEELLCTTSTSSGKDADPQSLAPELLRYMSCTWSPVRRRPSECYPDNTRLAKALETLAGCHKEASFLVPVGAVRAVDSLRALSKGGKALVIAGDKGYVQDSELEGIRDPHLAVHGSFSCMVNFRLLHLMCEVEGGTVLHSQHLDGFKCSAMAYGLDPKAYPQFLMAFRESTTCFTPNGFSSLQRQLKDESRGLGLRPALALLRLSQFDPDVFYKFKQVFIDKGPYAGEKLQNDIRRDVKLVHELYFPLQPSKDVAFEIGRIFMGLKDFSSAAELFRDSQRYCGVHHVSWYNMGVCFFYLNHLDEAENCFSESLALCPDYPDAIKWREKLADVKSFLAGPEPQNPTVPRCYPRTPPVTNNTFVSSSSATLRDVAKDALAYMTQEQEQPGSDEEKKVLMIHPNRGTADPKEGFRRGARGELRKSCDDCTASKTKCTGSIPCDRCKKRRIACKFSKRRRCGPKARAEDEKRPRTSAGSGAHPNNPSPRSDSSKISMPPTPPPLPPIRPIGINSSGGGSGGSGGGGGDLPPGDPPKFCGPLNSDGLSGLAELIAPTLSDTGGSGSSFSASTSHGGVDSSGYGRYAPLPGMGADGVSTLLGGGGTSPTNGGGNRAQPCAQPSALSSLPEAPGHPNSMRQQRSPRGRRTSLPHSQSAPTRKLGSCSQHDLPARAKSLPEIGFQDDPGGGGGGGGHMGFYPENTPMVDSMGNDLIGVGASGGVGGGRGRHQQHAALGVRGPLPMTLDERSKALLRTFMRSVGSLVVLPGNDAIRGAVFGDVGDSEEMADVATAGPGGAENDGKAGGTKGGQGTAEDRDGTDGGVVDTFAEACRAEAWAAAAVGAQFSGAPEQEGKDYVSRALRSMSRCLDAPLPEVAAVMILLALFWTHSMDTRKVARYFGFAQQVGLELGDGMPEGLRHTMAFLSSLVTMTLHLDQGASFAVNVKPHEAWGVFLPNSSKSDFDPFILALTAATVACNEMLHDGAGRGRIGVSANGLPPRVPPSQILTNLLATAAKALAKDEVQDGIQNPEHMLAILYGLKGYTHAARGELEEAEAAARLLLQIIDQHAAVLHLPLTYTLAEASRSLIETTAERNGRPVDSGLHFDALRGARTALVFARPGGGGGGGGGGAEARGGGRGGWCAFGDEIMSAFGRVCGVDDRDASTEANDDKGRPRSGSMSPPPRRSVRPPPRAEILSRQWKPSPGGEAAGGRHDPPRLALEPPSSSPLPRWNGIPTPGIPALSGKAAEMPSDWVDRVRRMPTIGPPRTSSPSVVHRMGGAARTSSPQEDVLGAGRGDSAGSLSLLGPPAMHTSAPNGAGVKYSSEPPDNLALLSTVASPGGYTGPPRRSSYEDRGSRPRRSGPPGGDNGGGGGGVGGGGGSSNGNAADRDGDDLPPPGNPGLSTGISFDPNRDDGTLPFTSLGPS
eukprot:g10311.t1